MRRRAVEPHSKTSCNQNSSTLHVCRLTFALSACWTWFPWDLNCKQKLLYPHLINTIFSCSKANLDQKAWAHHLWPIFPYLEASSCRCLRASGFDLVPSSFSSTWACAGVCLLSESWRRWSIPLKNNNFIFLPVWHDDISLSCCYRNRKAIKTCKKWDKNCVSDKCVQLAEPIHPAWADVDVLLKYCSNDGQNQIIQHTFRNVNYLEVRFCFTKV